MAFNFASVGGAAAGALEQFMLQQQQLKRQAMLDGMRQQELDASIADRNQQRELQQQQIAMQERAQDIDMRQLEGQEKAQGFQTALKVADVLKRGTVMTPEVEASLGPLAAGLTETTGGFVENGEGPTETKTFTGTQKDEQADQKLALQQRAMDLENEYKSKAVAVQAEVAAGRINQAQAGLLLQQERLELQKERAKVEIEATQAKMSEKKDAANAGEEARKGALTKSVSIIDSMLGNRNGLEKSSGPWEFRGKFSGDAQKFNAERDQLLALLAIPELPNLKGPLSDADILFVKSAVSILQNKSLSDEDTMRELQLLRANIQDRLERSSGKGDAASGSTPTSPDSPRPSARDLINKYRR